MRLKYQIFLTLLTSSAVLIAIMFALSNWSFGRGFLEYVNQAEEDRLSPITQELVYRYEEQGDWSAITPDELASLVSLTDRRRAPRPRLRDGRDGGARAARPPGPRPNNARRGGRPPALVLADTNKQVLVGQRNEQQSVYWIALNSNEKLIGYLGFNEIARVDRHFDQVFESKQKKSFIWTALAMIFLSGLVSIPLATFIVRPLLKVSSAVDEISGGNFKHRIKHRRRDELGDLADNINTLGVTLDENQNARRRWIAEISHELRTPLAVMRGELEAVQDGVRKLEPPVIDSLHTEVLGLSRLVDDLHTLTMSDVGALNYEMQPLCLSDLVRNFIASNETVLSEHTITASVEELSKPLRVRGDSQRLEQLLTNLLQNTCRYTDPGGQLIVKLSLVNTDDNVECLLEWLDSSPGVANKMIPKLFDPLFRTEESRNRELGGSGLGLSIVKRIVEAHQGQISAAESELGGLHLSIRLPTSAI